ncbi:MAG: HD domain-containing protein [Actinomycetota bacterium]
MNDLASAHHPEHAVDTLLGLFERFGRERYGEGINQEEHALQAAKQAIDEGAAPALVAAALLHDVGHLLVERDRVPTVDLRHEAVGARALARWFGPEVTNPIALHVDAKRYLCAVDPDYFGILSPGSVHSLELQGGPMTSEEVERFEALPGAEAAARLRRWDEGAKVPGVEAGELADHRELLMDLARERVTTS